MSTPEYHEVTEHLTNLIEIDGLEVPELTTDSDLEADLNMNILKDYEDLMTLRDDICYSTENQRGCKQFRYNVLEQYLNKKPHPASTMRRRDTLSSLKKRQLQSGPEVLERFTLYSAETGVIKGQFLSQLSTEGNSLIDVIQRGNFWIDVLSPTNEEIHILSKVFNIHPLTTEDIMELEAREKFELFPNYYFVCFRTFDQDMNSDTYLNPINIYNIVMPEGVITYYFKPTPHSQNVLKRIQSLQDYIEVKPDWINYAIVDDVTDAFEPRIENVELESNSIDELVLILKQSEQSDMLRRIGQARKNVMGLLRLLGPKADVVGRLIKRYSDKPSSHATGDDIPLYLGDIQDHILTMLQSVNHHEKILSRAHANYLAQISIEITQTQNATNDVIAKMTFVASFLVPMNIVTGLFGMNVKVPHQTDPEAIGEPVWPFYSIVAFLAAMGMMFYFVARWFKLI
ncbi:cora-domain-containing protein [Basidiobolus meristosporus CBS 931.73]|uniref:Cora-domain-containing protein n=1 Tax=Basidiobolus meristosporus CBS 931.73 TaxID=1314790 RepID=A0A1Y1YNR0_9FUNG|nr:cora-domain-containing protein [Basidiobolus meristosporus CBS 931.73]|eukprot:ORX99463.1 cora-domain-containing protein [Basidiobolus meristosporus CBS 931.73]